MANFPPDSHSARFQAGVGGTTDAQAYADPEEWECPDDHGDPALAEGEEGGQYAGHGINILSMKQMNCV
ncbi:MAG TPA: hypothetical protein VNU46_00450 [Gemmatimonadaceae bacterium]|jgi:hypothetical protein|nr:hypothetical protein [Gemmatimonadaceae bacterium]